MSSKRHVVVAGAGAAGLEAAASLHELAADRVELTLLAPDQTFRYRPVSTATPFVPGPLHEVPLARLCDDLGATQVEDELALVDEAQRMLVTRAGEEIPFDALVVAVGARLGETLPSAITWTPDGRATGALTALLDDLGSGAARSAVFVIPPNAGWPLPGYELALVAANAGHGAPQRPEVLVATAEQPPLGMLGEAATALVFERMAESGVDILAGARVEKPPPPRSEGGADAFSVLFARSRRGRRRRVPILHASTGTRPLRHERLIALPSIKGRFVPGLPHDRHGFLPVDEHARVRGTERVWAAGDATAVLLRHSVVGVAQADAAADSIAALAGAQVDPRPWDPLLHGFLVDPSPEFESLVENPRESPPTSCLWWPPGRLTGLRLSRLIARRDHRVKPQLGWHPRGLPTAAPVQPADGGPPPWGPARFKRADLVVDEANRSLQALRRLERESRRREAHAGDDLRRFAEREQEVVRQLEAAGYLRHHPPD